MIVIDFVCRLCMRHITIAIENMETNQHIPKDEEHISIIERIMQKTGDPKIAAVLALDLFLVGVDTVTMPSDFFVCHLFIRNFLLKLNAEP